MKTGSPKNQRDNRATKSGFTLIELMVSLAIFAFMTAFLLAKYGTFDQNTLLTNLAYDTAITIRSAQSYGLNVQGVLNASTCNGQAGFTAGNPCFFYPYGVHFGNPTPNNQFILFTDLNQGTANAGLYTGSNEDVSKYTMNRGYTIQSICAGTASSTCAQLSSLDITFKRPNPDAIIDGAQLVGGPVTNQAYAKITLTANGLTQSVVVQSTGQISITN
jgi:prepilin-type N-terminal cleavage/methylation domain-containing protein